MKHVKKNKATPESIIDSSVNGLHGAERQKKANSLKQYYLSQGIVFLDSPIEHLLYDMFFLSVKSNGFSIDIEYNIVKDYCINYKIDKVINVFRHLKSAVSVYSE